MDPMNGGLGNGNEREWIWKILVRIEDHIHEMKRFQARSEKRWEQSEVRWWANHRILVQMLAEIRRLKKSS